MSELFVYKPHIIQPQYVAPLLHDGIGKNITECFAPQVALGYDYFHNKIWTKTGTPTLITTPFGKAASFGAGNAYNAPAAHVVSTKFSILCLVIPYTGAQLGFTRIAETAFNSGWYLGVDSSGTKYKLIVNNSSSPYGTAEGGTLVTNKVQNVCATYDGTTGFLYVDGFLVGSSAFTAPSSPSLTTYISRYFGGGYEWSGAILAFVLWNGLCLTYKQAFDLYLNPWQIYQPIRIRKLFGIPSVTYTSRMWHVFN